MEYGMRLIAAWEHMKVVCLGVTRKETSYQNLCFPFQQSWHISFFNMSSSRPCHLEFLRSFRSKVSSVTSSIFKILTQGTCVGYDEKKVAIVTVNPKINDGFMKQSLVNTPRTHKSHIINLVLTLYISVVMRNFWFQIYTLSV